VFCDIITRLPGAGNPSPVPAAHPKTMQGVDMTSHITVPQGGQKIVPGQAIPNNPIIPFIEGDGR
jgi:hypothetical protein